jgi:hypothetical protein
MNHAIEVVTPLLPILDVSGSNFGPVTVYLRFRKTSLSYSIHMPHIRPLKLPFSSRALHYLSSVQNISEAPSYLE